MRYKILYILIMFCAFLNAQTTTYDNSNIFGEYHLVTSEYTPYSNEVAYNSTTTYSTSSGPRKAKSSGSGSATSDDGSVTVTYTYEWVGFFTYKVTVYVNGVAVETKTIYGSQWFGEDSLKQDIYDYAKDVANEEAEERRMTTPIGDCLYLLAFIIPYIIFLFHKNHRCILR